MSTWQRWKFAVSHTFNKVTAAIEIDLLGYCSMLRKGVYSVIIDVVVQLHIKF